MKAEHAAPGLYRRGPNAHDHWNKLITVLNKEFLGDDGNLFGLHHG
jgi:hypothetical protein